MKAFAALSIVLLVNSARGLDLPSDMDFSLNPLLDNYLHYLHDTPFSRELVAASSNSAPCSSPGYSWSVEQVSAMGFDTYNFLIDYGILDMPFIYKMLIDKNEDGEYFGVDGSQTEELLKRQQMTEMFWDTADVQDTITTDNILLLGAHGDVLKDYDKIVPTIQLFYPSLNATEVDYFVGAIQDTLETIPDGYNNPLLTANALAFAGGDVLGTGEIFPEVIVMGDGIIERLVDMGLGLSGPDFVHSHEFGHQLQFELGVYDDGALPSPEDTRNKELMADAFSAYFLAHDEGANMTADEILELHETAFSIGDCDFDSDGHHGTPAQRRCASMWGASQALVTGGQRSFLRERKLQNSYLIDPTTLRELFENDLDDILSLSSDICPLVIDDVVPSCDTNETLITINVQLDQYASETSWVLKGETYGTEVTNTYSSANNYELITEFVCVYVDEVYIFDILDVFGDGIIGGFYEIFNGTNTQDENALLIRGDGDFGFGTSVTFSLSETVDARNNTGNGNSTMILGPEDGSNQNATNTTEPEVVNSTTTTSSSSTSVTTTVTVSNSTTTTIVDPVTSVVTKTTITVSNSTTTTTSAV